MPSKGLSLVGFFADQQLALAHLKFDCVPDANASSDADLIAVWHAAQGQLGPAVLNAGQVNPQALSAKMQTYVNTLIQEPWVIERMNAINQDQANAGLPPATFQLVEIDPLLAYQYQIDEDRSQLRVPGDRDHRFQAIVITHSRAS